MIKENFKNEKNETNYASSKSFFKIGTHCSRSKSQPCTTIAIAIAKLSNSQYRNGQREMYIRLALGELVMMSSVS